MTKVIAGYTTSIDGFVADEQGGVERLYPDLADLQDKPLHARPHRRHWGRGDGPPHVPDGRPGYVRRRLRVPGADLHRHASPPAHHPKENGRISYTFVTDGVEPAVRMARARRRIARDGRRRCQPRAAAFRANLVDELHVDVMPVLLGSGLRFWGGAGLEHLRLETIGVSRAGERTTLKYRVIK